MENTLNNTSTASAAAAPKSAPVKFQPKAKKISNKKGKETNAQKVERHEAALKSATTEDEMKTALDGIYTYGEGVEAEKKKTALEKKLAELDEQRKQIKSDIRELNDAKIKATTPTAEMLKKLEQEQLAKVVASGDQAAIMAMFAKIQEKSTPKVSSRGGRKSKASAVDKNWNIENPFHCPSGITMNGGKKVGKVQSEEVWTNGSAYKCPYNCAAHRTTLAGMKKHFDKCPRVPDKDINDDNYQRGKESCSTTNNKITDYQFELYCKSLSHAGGVCGDKAKTYWTDNYNPELDQTDDE